MDDYTARLESIILNQLLPVYQEYYRLKGLKEPSLNIPGLIKPKRVAALLRGVDVDLERPKGKKKLNS